MRLKMIKWLIKWFVIKMHMYFIWSKLYRFLYEWKTDKTELPIVTSLDEVTELLASSTWTADGPKELWDAISSPEAAYHRLLSTRTLGDCDEHALFASKLIEQLGIGDVCMMSVIWQEPTGKLNGHNICVVKSKNPIISTCPYFFIGNWYQGRILNHYQNLQEIILAVVRPEKGNQLVSWFTYDPNLTDVIAYEIA